MNEVLKAIKERRSIRKYKSDMLSKEIIDQVTEITIGDCCPFPLAAYSPLSIT